MKENEIKNFDELPLFLSPEHIKNTLGISKASAYELMKAEGFPSIKVCGRIIVEREKFKQWLEEQVRA